MPALVIPDLNEAALNRLKARAQQNGRPLEAEAKLILEEAVTAPDPVWERIDRRRERLAATHPQASDSAELLREDRER